MFKNISKSLVYVISTIVIIGVVFGITSLSVMQAANDYAIVGYVNIADVQNNYSVYKTAVQNILNEQTRLSTELESKLKSLSNQNDKDKLTETYENNFANYIVKQLETPQKNFQNAVINAAKDSGVNIVLDVEVVVYGGTDITNAVKGKLGIK